MVSIDRLVSKLTLMLDRANEGDSRAADELLPFVYDELRKLAAQKMARVRKKVYQPKAHHKLVYDRLYAEYTRLHDWFGRGPSSTMKLLKQLKLETRSDSC